MTAKVIPFPPPQAVTLAVEVVTTPNVKMTMRCSPPMHYFTDRAEPCECGKERWPA